MPDTQNVIAIVKKLLIDNSEITDLVQDRIHTSHFYDLDNVTIQYPMIVLDFDSGRAGYGKSYQIFDLNIYVYSNINSDQCLSIYSKVYDTLQASRLYNSNLEDKGYIREVERPSNGYNDKVMSYFVLGIYRAITAG
jgi:hypothetical protein